VDPLRSAARTDLTPAEPLRSNAPAPAGTVLLAEAFDDGWHATGAGGDLTHGAGFGYVNAWSSPSAGPVTITHDGQARRYALLAGEALLWLVALVWWSRGRSRERAQRSAAQRDVRRERAARPGDFAPFGLDDDFWSEP
jgi:hypothetical protein